MAVFKCKMCGGTLEINSGETVTKCEYCGTEDSNGGTTEPPETEPPENPPPSTEPPKPEEDPDPQHEEGGETGDEETP